MKKSCRQTAQANIDRADRINVGRYVAGVRLIDFGAKRLTD